MEDKSYNNNHDKSSSIYSTNNTISQINNQYPPLNNYNSSSNNYNNYEIPSLLDLMSQINNMKNIMNQMTNHIRLQNTKNTQYENKINKLLTKNTQYENQINQLLRENKIILRENETMKIDLKILENQNDQMKKQIESLNQYKDSVTNDIVNRLNNIELNMEQFKEIKEKIILNEQQDNEQLQQINRILEILDKIILETDKMKFYLNGTIKENKEEIGRLKKEIDVLKKRIKELQDIIISRKIIKIILKKIIINCFESYSFAKEDKKYCIKDVKLKKKEYNGMVKVVNNLINTIYKENKIIHIEGAINRIIDILNTKTTYGDLLNICETILEKNDLSKIKQLFKEKIITLENCYPEIIEDDLEMKKILEEFSKKNNVNI